jgi:hypothetical protein
MRRRRRRRRRRGGGGGGERRRIRQRKRRSNLKISIYIPDVIANYRQLVDWYRGYGTTTPCAPRP